MPGTAADDLRPWTPTVHVDMDFQAPGFGLDSEPVNRKFYIPVIRPLK